MNHHFSSLTNRQHGLSIVELLIALAISSFLILGITQIYIDNKRSYNFQQSQGEIQENQRFLSMLMDGYLNRAGYQRSPTQLPENAFKNQGAIGDCPGFGTGETVASITDGEGICIRYYPFDTAELDCTGASPTSFEDDKAYNEAGDPIVMTLRHIPSEDLNGSLECQVGTRTAELLTGLADFRIFIEDNQVRYAALMSSAHKTRTSDESLALETWKQGADTTARARLQEGDKGQLFQMTTNTVALRNLTP